MSDTQEHSNDRLDIEVDEHFVETQTCFVYTPAGNRSTIDRPRTKRKKSSHVAESTDENRVRVTLKSHFDGEEESKFVIARYEAFVVEWKALADALNQPLYAINEAAIRSVVQFIQNGIENPDPARRHSQIPTCLIVTGPAISSYGYLYREVVQYDSLGQTTVMINITSTQCPNLKAGLKHIIRQGMSRIVLGDDEEDRIEFRPELRLLNYDMQSLYNQMKQQSKSELVVSFQGSESFDGGVLAELVEVFCSWSDRISIKFLFEIASSIENFQEKLLQSTIRRLQGTIVEATNAKDSFEILFRSLTSPEIGKKVWIGPALTKFLLVREQDYIQSTEACIQAFKYAYMTFFFANPLGILLYGKSDLQGEHYKAIKALPSVKNLSYIQELTKGGKKKEAAALLSNHESLHSATKIWLSEGHKALTELVQALVITDKIQSHVSAKQPTAWSELYLKAISAELTESPAIREVLMSVRKMPSNAMVAMLREVSQFLQPNFHDILSDLVKLTTMVNGEGPLRSEYDIHHETLRTTVIAQKVSLSRHKAALSEQDIAYSKIVDRVDLVLKEYFNKYLIDPKELVLHEVFLFDSKSTFRDSFAPGPRFAIERALSVPHDYLNCDCCESEGNVLSYSQPATAILYQLYLESGSIINISDLWSAFQAIVGPGQSEAEGEDDQTLALFYRAMSELKYLGLIKNSKKKIDHITKLSWKGL